MDLGVFPVRLVEANSPKHVSGGNNDHYTNNESAASKSDSGDSDAFSRHMRRNDENSAHDDKKPMSDQENVGEQKVKEPTGDQKSPEADDGDSGEASRDNMNFATIDIAAKKDMPIKREILLAPLAKAPTMVGAIKVGESSTISMDAKKGTATQSLLMVDPKSQMAGKITSHSQSIGEAIRSKDALLPVMDQAKSMSAPISIKPAPMAQAGAMIEKSGVLVLPSNGKLADGAILPADLVLDAPIDELPEIEFLDIKNFKALKTSPIVNQSSVNPSLMNFAAGLDEFQTMLDSGVESKAPMIGGAEAVSMIKSGMTSSVQAMAAAQPAAATAAAQLVAAIRTESKSGNIEVRLDPPEMGRVRITLSVETADAVKAVLTVERPETLDHLRRNMGQFTEDLRMAGFSSVDVEFSENDGSAFQDEATPQEHDPFATFVPESTPNNIVYLSLRENAQLDLLV